MKKILAAAVVLASAGTVQAQSPDAVIDRAVKAYTDMKSMRAEFTQTVTNPLTGTSAVSRGVILRKAPDLLSINFTNPSGDRVVADGKSLWVYLPSSAPNQVIKMPVGASSSMSMVDPGGLFLSSPSTRYTVTSAGASTIGGRKTSAVALIPKKSNNPFTRAKVWVDVSDNSIRQFEVVDANGLTRLVTITKVQPNASIQKSEFKFTPPKNARILDGSGMSGM